jgi:hypothetical protein
MSQIHNHVIGHFLMVFQHHILDQRPIHHDENDTNQWKKIITHTYWKDLFKFNCRPIIWNIGDPKTHWCWMYFLQLYLHPTFDAKISHLLVSENKDLETFLLIAESKTFLFEIQMMGTVWKKHVAFIGIIAGRYTVVRHWRKRK